MLPAVEVGGRNLVEIGRVFCQIAIVKDGVGGLSDFVFGTDREIPELVLLYILK